MNNQTSIKINSNIDESEVKETLTTPQTTTDSTCTIDRPSVQEDLKKYGVFEKDVGYWITVHKAKEKYDVHLLNFAMKSKYHYMNGVNNSTKLIEKHRFGRKSSKMKGYFPIGRMVELYYLIPIKCAKQCISLKKGGYVNEK